MNRRTNNKNTCGNIRNYFKQYCETTSIHGFKYFGENRSIFERIWWIIIFIFCLSGCSFMIFKIYDKYDTTPVIVTFSTKDTPIYEIPFPAVTICPETKSVKSKFDYTKTIQKLRSNQTLTETEITYLQYMLLLCDNFELYKFEENEIRDDKKSYDETYDDVINFTGYGNTIILKNLTLSGNDFLEFLDEFKPTVANRSLIVYCKYNKFNCKNLFVPVITDEGICYSFNTLDPSLIFKDLVTKYKWYHEVEKIQETWDVEAGYGKDSGLEAYPNRAYGSGAENGLTLVLATNESDFDFMCKQIQGFKVVLHSPVRTPKMKQEYFRVPLDQDVVAAVQPSVITTSEKVKKFDVEKRGCYFSTERKLKYFKFYSQGNCKMECATNFTLSHCKCVRIHMPRDNFTEICGPVMNQCARDAEFIIQFMGLNANLNQASDNSASDKVQKCDCLPLCTDITYYSETSQNEWKWEERYRGHKGIHLSKLTVYFKSDHFMKSERQELYGPTDFVANFGGLLGLFTGFSMLSLMEIIYFLTVRICCNVRLYGRWYGD